MGYVNSIREYYDRRRRHLLCLLVTSVWATWKKGRKKDEDSLPKNTHTHRQSAPHNAGRRTLEMIRDDRRDTVSF